MPWPCHLVEYSGGPYPDEDVGAVWYALPSQMYTLPNGRWSVNGYELSDEYMRDWYGKRLPIFVTLPRRFCFCIDSASTDPPGTTHGWAVAGDPPRLTVTPSINAVGIYHGFITDGIVTDG